MMLLGALYPIGAIAQGAIADEIGLRATTAGAAVLLAALLVMWRVFRRPLAPDRPTADPEPPDPRNQPREQSLLE